MREGTAPLLVCLLLVMPVLVLSGDPGSLAENELLLTASAVSPSSRGPIEWTSVGNITVSSYLNDTTEINICFDNQNSTFTASPGYDPYFDHNATVRAAIDAAPQWLNDSLSWRFSEFWSHPGQKWAELLLNDTIDWRYRDEIAFTIAHLPSQITYSYWVWPELIVENVEMIYKVADEVPYATLTDINTTNGLRTTITYRIPGGNVTLPDDIYYENLVMPRNSLETPNYVNRSTKRYTYPYDGWFWRNFLYYESDPGYPILRNMLVNQTTLWNGTRNQAQSNGAIGAVTEWQMLSMVFGMPDYRSSQPVLAYGEHIGMCGENSYLLAAVAKTALIPAVTVINFDWMHGWNMFYDRGWHVWRAYDGIIDDTYAEGGPGSVSAHTAFNPDSSQFNPAYLHTQTANLTVRVVDDKGVPVDGTMVKLFSYGTSNYIFNHPLIGNHTDVNGEANFEVGMGFQYYAQVISPIGLHLDESATIPLALPDPIPGMHYWFNVTLNRSMPLKANFSKLAKTEFGMRFNITLNEIHQETRPEMDAHGYDRWFWKGYQNSSILRTFILDDENFSLYSSGQEFFPKAVLNITLGMPSSIIVPDDRKWHIIVPGLANPLTRGFVHLTVETYRSKVYPEAIILSPEPGSYYLGEMIHFAGMLDPYPPYLGDVQYRWFRDGSGLLNEEAEFDMALTIGVYHVIFSVWDGTELIDSDVVIFEVLQPNRAPVSSISSPEEGSIFVAGTEITFGSEGTWDPDVDLLSYKWTETSTGTELSQLPSFSRKFIIGHHIVQLNVSDPDGLWSTSTVSFTVIQANSPPTPFISSPENYASYYEDEVVFLSANGTFDIDGDDISYDWSSDLSGHLSTRMEDKVRLVLGEHLITLTIGDGNVSVSTNVSVYIEERQEPEDLPPVAVIDKPSDGQNFFVRELIEFNSIGSFDPEGYHIDHLWKVDGNNVSTSPSFSMYLREGIHSISLTVFDQNQSATTSYAVIVTNRAPIMTILLNSTSLPEDDIITVLENETLIFDAYGSSDPDGGELTYNWMLDGEIVGSGPQIAIILERGNHQLKLTITDEDGRSSTLIIGLNCIVRTEPDDDGDGVADGDKGGVSIFLYLIPSILIILFLAIAIVFFLLSREKKDEYFEE